MGLGRALVPEIAFTLIGTLGSVCACAGSDKGNGSGISGAETAGAETAGGASGTSSVGSGGRPSGGSEKAGSAGAQSAFVWTRPSPLFNYKRPDGFWGANALDVYTHGSGEVWHGSGTSWQKSTFESSSEVYVSGNSATEVFLLQRDGSFYQSSGDHAWTLAPQQPELDPTYNSFRGLRSFGEGIYAFGHDLQRREPDGSWSTVLDGTTLPGSVSEAWGSSADDFYVCVDSGNAGVYHRRGTTLVLEREGHCPSLSGTGPRDVYVAGVDGLSHSQGDGQWDPISLQLAQGETPFVVFAQAPNAVFVGTNDSTMFFFDGTEWTNIGRQMGGSHEVIWAPSPDEVYVCGLDGPWYGKRRGL